MSIKIAMYGNKIITLDGKIGMYSPPDPYPIITIIYGYLYNYYATIDASNITSSADWSMSSSANWSTLTTHLGGSSVAGSKLKSTKTALSDHPFWASGNVATDEVNFGALGGGLRTPEGVYDYLTEVGYYWAGDRHRKFDYDSSTIVDSFAVANYGFSIRLLRNATGPEIASKLDGDACAVYTGNDGTTYKTVYIDEKVWTAENLAETKYRDGTDIPKVTNNAQWEALTTSGYCAWSNDDYYAITFDYGPVA